MTEFRRAEWRYCMKWVLVEIVFESPYGSSRVRRLDNGHIEQTRPEHLRPLRSAVDRLADVAGREG